MKKIPKKERWLYKNKSALKAVQKGIQESKDRMPPANAPDLEADYKEFGQNKE